MKTLSTTSSSFVAIPVTPRPPRFCWRYTSSGSVDVNSKAFAMKNLLDTPLSFEQLQQGTTFSSDALPSVSEGYALHLVGFTLQNKAYTQAKLKVEGVTNYQVFVDGKKQGGMELTLEPSTHPIVIKYLSEAGKNESLKVSVETEKDGIVTLREDGKRNYTLGDVLHGTRFSGISLSPNGKYLMTSYRTTQVGGRSSGYTTIKEFWKSALVHTIKVFIFIFIVSLVLNLVFELGGAATLEKFASNNSVFAIMLTGLVGLIPNCAASVMITQLYLKSVISAGTMMAGLLVSAGVGVLVLFRTNHPMKQNVKIVSLLYAMGVVAGFMIDLVGITFV